MTHINFDLIFDFLNYLYNYFKFPFKNINIRKKEFKPYEPPEMFFFSMNVLYFLIFKYFRYYHCLYPYLYQKFIELLFSSHYCQSNLLNH